MRTFYLYEGFLDPIQKITGDAYQFLGRDGASKAMAPIQSNRPRGKMSPLTRLGKIRKARFANHLSALKWIGIAEYTLRGIEHEEPTSVRYTDSYEKLVELYGAKNVKHVTCIGAIR